MAELPGLDWSSEQEAGAGRQAARVALCPPFEPEDGLPDQDVRLGLALSLAQQHALKVRVRAPWHAAPHAPT